jgi:hypothetical protein
MLAFAEGGGFLAKTAALKLVHRHYQGSDVDKIMGVIKPELTRLRASIREAVGVKDPAADPLPFDDGRQGWHAEVGVAYAVQEDGDHVGGERRLRFRTRDELSREESADR